MCKNSKGGRNETYISKASWECMRILSVIIILVMSFCIETCDVRVMAIDLGVDHLYYFLHEITWFKFNIFSCLDHCILFYFFPLSVVVSSGERL